MIYVGAGRSRTSSLGGSKNTLLYSSNADNEGKGIDVDEFKSLYNNDNPLYEKKMSLKLPMENWMKTC